MDHPSAQKLRDHLAELQSEHAHRVEKRAELLLQIKELASRQMELKAMIQDARSKGPGQG